MAIEKRRWIQERAAGIALTLFLSSVSLVSPVDATVPYYDGYTAFAAPTCNTAPNGRSLSTGARTSVWSTPPGGATETRYESVNARPLVATADRGPFPSPAASGMMTSPGVTRTVSEPYPFTYVFQLATFVDGNLVSISAATMTCAGDGPARTSFVIGAPPPALENPQPDSYQSGVGLLSGWSCPGPYIEMLIDSAPPLVNVPYGGSRGDTATPCGSGNTNTGFGLLFNFNTLGAGAHSIRLAVNGQLLGPTSEFTVTVPMTEFASGLSRQVMVPNFPAPGRTTILIWQESQQNFAIRSVTP